MKQSLKLVSILSLLASPYVFGAEPGLKNQSEAGIVVVSGNSKSQSYSVKQNSQYNWETDSIRFDGRYLKTTSFDVESAKQWSLGLRYDRILSTDFSLFASQIVESNIFSGTLQRYNTDLGGQYHFYKLEKNFIWFAEAGYRFTRENRSRTLSKNLHYARVFTEATRYFSETVFGKAWIEYLPNFTESTDWQLNTELSLSAMISQIFSMKTAYLINYDHLPNKGNSTDSTFTTSLVANF